MIPFGREISTFVAGLTRRPKSTELSPRGTYREKAADVLDKVEFMIKEEGEDNALASLQSDAYYVHIKARGTEGTFILVGSTLHSKPGGPSAEIFDGLVPVAFLIPRGERGGLAEH
ncbi:uncharacterized protein FSUBG_13703 [Fusarium subglutinans]|uniref:Uncharacterized protein n=1 Tax=Gibberella subglutinans TaxID=42677 RepID=A0A8H5KVR7_GIBSU|nr:uncharacterized protein FSUBG_13703 [Fusarium subglutinans]KAF5578870.1 hypothetical protein FSUBG_13703 [Fusarium subglutinans]